MFCNHLNDKLIIQSHRLPDFHQIQSNIVNWSNWLNCQQLFSLWYVHLFRTLNMYQQILKEFFCSKNSIYEFVLQLKQTHAHTQNGAFIIKIDGIERWRRKIESMEVFSVLFFLRKREMVIAQNATYINIYFIIKWSNCVGIHLRLILYLIAASIHSTNKQNKIFPHYFRGENRCVCVWASTPIILVRFLSLSSFYRIWLH